MKPGHVYESFGLSDGRDVLLRAISGRDLAESVRFVNSLVKERSLDPNFGILLDTRVTRREERRWLTRTVGGIRKGNVVSVAAFHGGRLVGNCDLHRERSKDLRHCGEFGIAILKGYRSAGLGRRMLEVLLEESKKAGITLVELRVLSVNRRAIRLYRSLGFRRAGSVPGKIIRGRRRIDEVRMFREG